MPGSCHQLTVAQRSRKPWPYLRPVIPVIPPAVEWMLGSQGVQGYSLGSVPRTRAVPTREAIEGRSRAPPTLSFVVTQSSGLAPKVDSGAARVGDRRLTTTNPLDNPGTARDLAGMLAERDDALHQKDQTSLCKVRRGRSDVRSGRDAYPHCSLGVCGRGSRSPPQEPGMDAQRESGAVGGRARRGFGGSRASRSGGFAMP